jgi:hypothetical protein
MDLGTLKSRHFLFELLSFGLTGEVRSVRSILVLPLILEEGPNGISSKELGRCEDGYGG